MGVDVPTIAGYLGKLPHGAASYADVQVKGSILRAVLSEIPEGASVRTGIPEVDRLVEDPPPLSAWVPEVHFNALMLAVYEQVFASAGGIPAFVVWVYEGNRRMLRGPLYRVLFAVVSPERVLIGLQKRWSAFRRGTTLSVVSQKETLAVVKHTHPPHLMNELAAHGFAGAFRAASEAAGAKDVFVTFRESSPTETLFEARWAPRNA